MIVTIDGPAGSGKSTAAIALAARLGFEYLDTGAMYRAVALALARRGIDLADAGAVGGALAGLSVEAPPGRDVDVARDVAGRAEKRVAEPAVRGVAVDAGVPEQAQRVGEEGDRRLQDPEAEARREDPGDTLGDEQRRDHVGPAATIRLWDPQAEDAELRRRVIEIPRELIRRVDLGGAGHHAVPDQAIAEYEAVMEDQEAEPQ